MIEPISSLSAALAASTHKVDEAEAAPLIADAKPAGTNFSDFISSIGGSFADSLKAAEMKSMDGMLGKASTREVVEAVMSADQTLQTAMAFRDKVVSAYLEIVKMPI